MYLLFNILEIRDEDYLCNKNLDFGLEWLGQSSIITSTFFEDNYLKFDSGQSHIIFSGNVCIVKPQ